MATYALRGLTSDLVARAKSRARQDGTTLDAVITRYLETYAEHGSPQAAGARAVNQARTAAERREAARVAARARWADHRSGS